MNKLDIKAVLADLLLLMPRHELSAKLSVSESTIYKWLKTSRKPIRSLEKKIRRLYGALS